MSTEVCWAFPDGRKSESTELKANQTMFLREKDGETTKIIAIYTPWADYGAEVHELAEEDVDIDKIAEEGVPEGLLTRDTQVGYVFANTYNYHPSKLPRTCGRILIRHILPKHHLN